ncbi:hypothetical protein DN439_04030 [Lactobacillus reuteri]|uniref:DUF4355 domain-containing protein n=1 Tax=Limosilactobacillus reuteri TaxID=1598 RepID=UPI00128DB4CC|nr:DUF4355 domain-containing protein [Limosilactobacillus reuteri]MQB72811.1 hypothetical protein [Limosilactobacillus reuteri]
MNDDQQQPTPQQSEGQNEQQGNQEQGSKVDFTPEQQTAIDNMIAEKVAKERQKAEAKAQEAAQKAEQAKQDAIKKAEERAKMTAEERAKAEREDQQKAIKEQQAELNRQMREFSTKNMLLDKGISVDLLPLVMGADDDETSQRLDLLKKYRDKEVQAATEKLMSGKKAPSAGNGGAGVSMHDNPWSDQAWNMTKQQEIFTTDPEKARQMIAQAQPKRAFYIGMNN